MGIRGLIIALPPVLMYGGCMQYLIQPPEPSIAGSPQTVRAKSYLGSEIQQHHSLANAVPGAISSAKKRIMIAQSLHAAWHFAPYP